MSERRLPALPLREELILPLAHVADAVQHLAAFRVPLTREAIWITRQRARTDDSRARNELGFTPRDLRETLVDTVRSLVATGRLSPQEAGALASDPRPASA